MDNQLSEFSQLLAGAGTPVSVIIVFLLYRLNKEVGDLKVQLQAYTDMLLKFTEARERDDRRGPRF